jgi:hypothetical protein
MEEITKYTDRAADTTQLALKIRDAVLGVITEEEKNSGIYFDESVWLAMQMLCGPRDAASVISYCQVQNQ